MKATNPKITIVSCGIEEGHLLPLAQQAIAQAPLIIGYPEALQRFTKPNQRTLTLKGDPNKALLDLYKNTTETEMVVLASGDSLFHGLGGTLHKRLPPENLFFIPGITAFQSLCAKLKIPFDDIHWVSLHREMQIPCAQILQQTQVGIYTNPQLTGSTVAEKLIHYHPPCASRRATLATQLGSAQERIHSGSLEEMCQIDTNGKDILLLHPFEDLKERLPLPLGRDDNHYKKEAHLITQAPVRAILLSQLKLIPGVFWDLGAGSGSVGIEARLLCPQTELHCVEKKPSRALDIQKNIDREGLNQCFVHQGTSQELIEKLPTPSRIFIGGGGKDLSTIFQNSWKRLPPGGILCATAVTLESQSILNHFLTMYSGHVLSLNISKSTPLGDLTLMKSHNPVSIYTYEKK